MAVLQWDNESERLYETGVDKGVVYPYDSTPKSASDKTPKGYVKGYAWNGLTGFTESPEGADSNDLYADNDKYLSLISAENLKGTLEAYMYPPEFEECDGTKEITTGVTIGQQNRKTFGFCYRTYLGNDTDGNDHGYKIHCIYGAKAAPSEKAYQTVNDSPDAITFSWEISTTPVSVKIGEQEFKKTASVTINSTKLTAAQLKAIEDVLYGTETEDPRLPLPSEIYSIISSVNAG